MTPLLQPILGGVVPEWLVIVLSHLAVTALVLLGAAVMMMLAVWAERRIIARMQDRLGPNRVGPAGLLQSIADGVKMFVKEDIVPRAADRWIHILAPIVALAPVAMMLAVIPWGRGLVAVDLDVGVLYVAAVSSISGVGLLMAGWGSSNRFALLGAMRAVAQLVSYEIPMIIAILGMVLLSGGMSLARMPELQGGLPIVGTTLAGVPDLGLGWFVFTPVGLLGFAIFFICVLAEGERTPFDIPEADSEIIAGYMTEYSGMKFAVFYLAQYILNLALAMVTAVLFLGGWQGPGIAWLAANGLDIPAAVLSLIYMLLKVWLLFFVMVLLRGAFPRLRVDQLLSFAWKFLLPLALVNVGSIAIWIALTNWSAAQWGGVLNLDMLAAWQRQLLAVAVTAVINIAAYRWVLAINQPQQPETPDELIGAAQAS
ncbi:MAG TPA: NADH-quinone oxidoreductase subunit NuoH [Roseiflexaceae bacterium]|nr:NADH-quinone oxidoreductase subunit NuoH [Roseiflexaceae bacterium]